MAALSARVHALRPADDVLAGGDLIGPAFRELNAAVQLCEEGRHAADVGPAPLSLVGEFAQITGWIASDSGEHECAKETYELGLSAAREAGDALLESNLIGSLAYRISNLGDPERGVELTKAAVVAASRVPSSRAEALAWDRLAWAHTRHRMYRPTMGQDLAISAGLRLTGRQTDRTGHARSSDPAVAVDVVVKILLVVAVRLPQ
ncbi:hypothetical protein ACTMTI_46765 [Nonomuraea sp. H19]|uniref:hypothetical protein n=1 Tax=Nonomuraea sp. H19 TaxID=3452206 RepID=UPI003F896EC8